MKKTTEQKFDSLVSAIKGWDKEDIRELSELITDFEEFLNTVSEDGYGEINDYIDFSSLPSADIPDDVDTGYPIWAMDKNGNCLIGDAADDIENIEVIRENVKELRKGGWI